MILDLFMSVLKAFADDARWPPDTPVTSSSGAANSKSVSSNHPPDSGSSDNLYLSHREKQLLSKRPNDTYFSVRLERTEKVLYSKATELGVEYAPKGCTQIFFTQLGVGLAVIDELQQALTQENIGCQVRVAGYTYKMWVTK